MMTFDEASGLFFILVLANGAFVFIITYVLDLFIPTIQLGKTFKDTIGHVLLSFTPTIGFVYTYLLIDEIYRYYFKNGKEDYERGQKEKQRW